MQTKKQLLLKLLAVKKQIKKMLHEAKDARNMHIYNYYLGKLHLLRLIISDLDDVE